MKASTGALKGIGHLEMRADKGQNGFGKRLLREINGAKATLRLPETY